MSQHEQTGVPYGNPNNNTHNNMNTKAIEILSTIAEDNNNTSHSNLSLAYQAAVKVALHELQKPTPEPTHPLIDALNKHIRKMVDECVEHAVNDSFKDIDDRLDDADSRLNSLENADNENVSDLESRMDDVENRLDSVEDYESRIDDLEKGDRNDETHDNLNSLLESVQEHDEQISKAETRLDTLEAVEAASKLTSRDIVLAITDYIRTNLA
jgi:chromosome segregation ATPase